MRTKKLAAKKGAHTAFFYPSSTARSSRSPFPQGKANEEAHSKKGALRRRCISFGKFYCTFAASLATQAVMKGISIGSPFKDLTAQVISTARSANHSMSITAANITVQNT